MRDLPRFDPVETHAIDVLYRRRIRSLQAVDRGVARLVHTLRATKQLDDTYIVFASDNGFHLGQHRMPAGKQTPYETDVHVPLIVRGPGVRAGAHVTRLAGNTDLAPTFEAMAGACVAVVHRRSILLPLLHGERPGALADLVPAGAPGRDGHDAARTRACRRGAPRSNRPIPTRPDPTADRAIARSATPCCWTAAPRSPTTTACGRVATSRCEYATGERELYDLRHDPDEIHNLAGTLPGRRQRLDHRIAAAAPLRRTRLPAAEDAPVPR